MRIKRIYIKDFGIFRDEKLENLNENIIVIGGYNRAGKTTLSKLFRHLGFGFSKVERSIPEANISYSVNYDIENTKGEVFNVDIEGRKSPQVTSVNTSKELSIGELFGNIDYFTYKQLFNISLDELQNTSIHNLEEMSNMQSVLLGAGFKQIIQIPKFLKDLDRESRRIGGKNGSPSTAEFKTYYTEIKEGIALRNKAKLQVDVYYDKKNLLNDTKNKINTLNEGLQQALQNKKLVNTLQNNFKSYESLINLDAHLHGIDLIQKEDKFKFTSIEKAEELKESYEKLQYQYELKRHELIEAMGINKDVIYTILEAKDKIKQANSKISGITESIKNYKEIKDNCIRLKEEILKNIVELNEKWKGDFNKVLRINTDTLEFHKLNRVIESHKELAYKKKDLEDELKSLESNKEVLSKTVSKKELMDFNKLINRSFYISLVMVVFGIGLAFVDYKIGLGLAISSSILGGACIFIAHSSKNSYLANKDVHIKLDELNNLFVKKGSELKQINTDLEVNKVSIQGYKDMLDIEDDISVDMLKDYFTQIRYIKGKINNLQELVNKATIIKNTVESKLTDILHLIEEFSQAYDEHEVKSIKSELIERAADIFKKTERLNDYLGYAENLNVLEYEKKILEEKIAEVISWNAQEDDSILKHLEYFIEEGKVYRRLKDIKLERNIVLRTLINMFKSLGLNSEVNYIKGCFEKYTSYDEVEKEYRELIKKIEEIEEELRMLVKRKEALKLELEVLYSTEDIEKAERKIYKARKELFPLAKKYASLKGAEFILKKIQENFIDRTKDSLLKGASNYLEEITRGEYINILPTDDLGSLDFKSVLKDGSVKESSNILSRATKEQLFLSVRLSRIKEIETPLPIILDDSFVNFDESHTKEVIKILNILSNTNQIFITTCHSRVVNYFGCMGENVKYVKLERGKFEDCSKEELVNYLASQQI